MNIDKLNSVGKECWKLLGEIESLPASEQQTKCSVMCYDLLKQLNAQAEEFNQLREEKEKLKVSNADFSRQAVYAGEEAAKALENAANLEEEVERRLKHQLEAAKLYGAMMRYALFVLKSRIHFIGMPQEEFWEHNGKKVPDWRKEIALLEEALAVNFGHDNLSLFEKFSVAQKQNAEMRSVLEDIDIELEGWVDGASDASSGAKLANHLQPMVKRALAS